MKSSVILLLVALLAIPDIASSEIYKLAVPGEKAMEFYWWPVLGQVPGWSHDEEASRANSANILVPKGSSFSSAPAVIYGKAMFKPRVPNTKSLGQLIADDRKAFEHDFPGVAISELAAVSDGDGKKLRYFSYTPSGAGSWELVAYGEEGEFYLIFTVSGNSKAALIHAKPVFESVIAAYREGP
jgi:hypothetical protein